MEKKLSIPSQIDSIKIVEKWVDDISSEYNFDNAIYGNVLISVVEAVNNAILHGNKSDANKNVEMVFIVDTNRRKYVFKIKDQGKGFNFGKIPDPTAPENLEALNGRGIFLMHKLSDEILFFDNGACVELKFNY